MQYIKDEHANAEHDDIDTFKFLQPNGSLMLSIETIQQSGWIVYPHKSPMKVNDSCATNPSSLISTRFFKMLLTSSNIILNIQVVACQYMLNLVLLKNHFIVLSN